MKATLLVALISLVFSTYSRADEEFSQKALKAVEGLNGKQGILAWGAQVGSLYSAPAFGGPEYCKVQVGQNFVKIIQYYRPDNSGQKEPDKEIISITTSEVMSQGQEGQFTTNKRDEKNSFSLCMGKTVSAQYSLQIKEHSLSITRHGTCTWMYQDHPQANFAETYECRL